MDRSPGIRPIRLRHLFRVNCYLVAADEGDVLIDTGFPPGRRDLETALRAAGCRPGRLRLIVLTHGHTDHAGNCAYLRRIWGAPLAMHAGDLEKVRRGDMFWRADGGARVATAVARTLLRVSGMGSFARFAPDLLLGDGQHLGAYGLDATVLSLPGHTPGSIGVLTSAGDLFCGDLLVNTRRPAPNTLAEDAPQLAASVTTLQGRGIRTVYPGHGAPFDLRALPAPCR